MKILLKREKVAGERAAIFDGEFSGKKLIKYQIMIFPLIFTKFFLCISLDKSFAQEAPPIFKYRIGAIRRPAFYKFFYTFLLNFTK